MTPRNRHRLVGVIALSVLAGAAAAILHFIAGFLR